MFPNFLISYMINRLVLYNLHCNTYTQILRISIILYVCVCITTSISYFQNPITCLDRYLKLFLLPDSSKSFHPLLEVSMSLTSVTKSFCLDPSEIFSRLKLSLIDLRQSLERTLAQDPHRDLYQVGTPSGNFIPLTPFRYFYQLNAHM